MCALSNNTSFILRELRNMSGEEENLEIADLPTSRKKYLMKIIKFSIFCVVFFGWGAFSIITYISHYDYEGVSLAWGIIYTLSMIISPIIGIAFFGKTMKNSRLLKKVIRKQKGIEPKDKTKYYYEPDEETLAYFKKKSKNLHVYFYAVTLLSLAFMLFYGFTFQNTPWIFRVANYIWEIQFKPGGDILFILGIFPLCVVVFWLYAIGEWIFESIRRKREQKPLTLIGSFRTDSKTMFPEKNIENDSEDEIISEFELEEHLEEEPIDKVKEYINLHNLNWAYILIWTTCYVLGIPLKIFLPLYITSPSAELSLVIQIFTIVFWIGFTGIYIAYLIKMIPVWKKIKNLEIKIDME
jgi:hypothetical protein